MYSLSLALSLSASTAGSTAGHFVLKVRTKTPSGSEILVHKSGLTLISEPLKTELFNITKAWKILGPGLLGAYIRMVLKSDDHFQRSYCTKIFFVVLDGWTYGQMNRQSVYVLLGASNNLFFFLSGLQAWDPRRKQGSSSLI